MSSLRRDANCDGDRALQTECEHALTGHWLREAQQVPLRRCRDSGCCRRCSSDVRCGQRRGRPCSRLAVAGRDGGSGDEAAGPLLLQSAPVCEAPSRYPPQRACVSFCLKLQPRLLLELTHLLVIPARDLTPDATRVKAESFFSGCQRRTESDREQRWSWLQQSSLRTECARVVAG